MSSVKMQEGIGISVLSKTVFNDYEIYNIEVVNNNYNQLLLDNLHETKNIYLEDQNGNKYIWLSHEYIEDELVVNKELSKTISIKFNKNYNPALDANKMVLKGIVIDNEKAIEFAIDV